MYINYMKRIIDVVVSIVFAIPIFLISIILIVFIKINSKGPVLFKQKRLGKNGQEFNIYKFRTMVNNAESIGTGVFTSDQDPRITKTGHFLRKTSLDELPQIINILKGDMSFVGPRPPVPYHPYKIDEYSEVQKKRFAVRPGITGLAQAYGRNTLSWDERIEYDIEYVKKMNFFLDIKIILKTISSVIRKEDIYRDKQ